MRKSLKILRVALLIIGVLFVLYSVALLSMNNFNLGNVLSALLGIPLLVYGIFAPALNRWFAKGAGRAVKWFFICGYAFLICVFAVFGIMMGAAANTVPPKDADVVMVLGAALRGTQPSDTLARRLDIALAYGQENPNALFLVSGGQGPQEEIPEAHAMRDYLIAHGVEESRILVEDKSRSTQQNFLYSKPILDERFGTDNYTLVFATNDFHILRGYINAESVGMSDVHGLPYRSLIYTAPPNYMRESLALLATYVFGADVT